MSLPTGRSNATATIFDNVDELGLSISHVSSSDLTALLGNNATDTSSDIALGVKGSLFVLADLATGDLTIEVDEFAEGASHDFSSPAGSLVLASGDAEWLQVDFSTASTLNFGIKLTADSSGCQINKLLVKFVTEKTHKAGWYDGGTEHNAAQDDKINDGSGVVSNAPAADHTYPA